MARAESTPGDASGFRETVLPFITKHCLRCHNDREQQGQFRIDQLSSDFTDTPSAERWSEVLFRMNANEMPPPDEPQPTVAELSNIAAWLNTAIREGEAARLAKRGPVTHYRLSRDEYAATVRDLLGVSYDVTLPGLFSEDPRWHGFERIGSALSLSPSHVDRYLKAAETVLERAFPVEPVAAITRKADAIEMRHHHQRERLEKMGIADRVRAIVWPGGSVGGLPWWHGGDSRRSGVYRIRIRLSGLPGLGGASPHLSVWNPKLKRSIFDEDIITPEDQPTTIEFETFLEMPCELHLVNEIPSVFGKEGNHAVNVLNMDNWFFTSSAEIAQQNPTGYKLFDDHGHAIHPLLLVDSFEWEGPLTTDDDRRKREGLIPLDYSDRLEVAGSLTRFAIRAWRRPVLDEEISRYVDLMQHLVAAGETPQTAYRSAMVGILASKNFYYLEEGSAVSRREELNDFELASRLSYFLWGSMPDDELCEVAARGELLPLQSRQQQLRRMLNDRRISRFAETFPRQWLQLHKVGMFPPDPKLYPKYDLWLEKSMVSETTHYFGEMLANNLPLRELLVSNWTVVNPRLATFYQLPSLQKSGFQKVNLPPEAHRGGILTQAAVLMLTSDGTRHRPVHRGVWVNEAIFAKTPPPPPPNVEPLKPTPSDQPKATVRMQLEAHATHAVCASCHRNIDPYGFAFDHFDAIGRWRSDEVTAAGQGANPPIDASGSLPDGRSFTGADDFKQLLVSDQDRFAEAFVEQLATFALRRMMTYDDRKHFRAIVAATRSSDHQLRDIIEQLVLSPLFSRR